MKTEYLYVINDQKYINKIVKIKEKYNYVPLILNETTCGDPDQIIGSSLLIGCRKPILSLQGYLKIIGCLKKSSDSELFNNLVIDFMLVEIPGLYFLKFQEFINFNDIYSKKILLKELNQEISKYDFSEIKFPKNNYNFAISQFFVSKFVKIIDNIYKDFIITEDNISSKSNKSTKSTNSSKSSKSSKLSNSDSDSDLNSKSKKSNKNIKKKSSDESDSDNSDESNSSDSNSSDESNSDNSNESDSDSNNSDESDSNNSDDSDIEDSEEMDEEEYFRRQAEKEAKKAYTFKLDKEDVSKVVVMEIPVLWVPCEALKDNIRKGKVSKKIFSNHYFKCEICETVNNNRNDINITDILLTYKDDDNDEEMDELIKYYKFTKKYVVLKSKTNGYGYDLTKINALYYENPFEKVYNECIFMIKLREV